MKISTSASYFEIPVVQAELHTCDLIFTSQRDSEDKLRAVFGDKIRIIAHGDGGLRKALQDEGVEEGEVITFGSLRKIIKAALQAKDQITAGLLTEYCGWRPNSDATHWSSRNHTEMKPIYIEGIVPDEIMESMVRSF